MAISDDKNNQSEIKFTTFNTSFGNLPDIDSDKLERIELEIVEAIRKEVDRSFLFGSKQEKPSFDTRQLIEWKASWTVNEILRKHINSLRMIFPRPETPYQRFVREYAVYLTNNGYHATIVDKVTQALNLPEGSALFASLTIAQAQDTDTLVQKLVTIWESNSGQ